MTLAHLYAIGARCTYLKFGPEPVFPMPTQLKPKEIEAFKRHLKTLGLPSVEAYRIWCQAQGFDPAVKKHWRERRQEQLAAKRMAERQDDEAVLQAHISNVGASQYHRIPDLVPDARIQRQTIQNAIATRPGTSSAGTIAPPGPASERTAPYATRGDYRTDVCGQSDRKGSNAFIFAYYLPAFSKPAYDRSSRYC